MKTYIKEITIAFALFGFVFQSFARTQYNENTLVDSDVSDSQIIVDSSSRGNVKVSVAENVSLTGNSLSIYGENSSMEFLGNNEINVGNISVYKGASINAHKANITASSIYLQEEGASLFFKDCQTTINGQLTFLEETKLTIDGGSFFAQGFTWRDIFSSEKHAEINVLNGGNLEIANGGWFQRGNKFDIYVDSTSSFTNSSRTKFSGKLSFEAGAEVSFSNLSNIDDMYFEFVVDDISAFQDKELNEYFETITLAGSSIENLLTSENLTVFDKSTNMTYNIRISDSGTITIIPEPSTYAAVFGAAMLVFAAYRRRR